jgi:Bacterial regulatory proteins, tetR family
MGEVAETKPETATAVFRLLAGGSLEPLPRHRHGLSRDDIQEAQRVRITAAAIELFATDGYATTSVLTIAKRAGVPSKTFYEPCATKEDLFSMPIRRWGWLQRVGVQRAERWIAARRAG